MTNLAQLWGMNPDLRGNGFHRFSIGLIIHYNHTNSVTAWYPEVKKIFQNTMHFSIYNKPHS